MERCAATGKVLPIIINSGEKYGLWTVLNYVGKYKTSNNCWECVCECGRKSIIPAYRLVSGGSKACQFGGHMKGVNQKHGMKNTKLYSVWNNMKQRCYNSNASNYSLYGGRGIRVSDEWLASFENFYKDMAAKYGEGVHLDRIDVNGNYCKENCRWVTPKVNATNKRNTAFVTYKGVTKRAYEWAELIGVNPKTISRRVYLGYTPEECLFGRQYEQIKRLILAESLLNL